MKLPTTIICPECQRTLGTFFDPNRFSPLVSMRLCQACKKRLSAEIAAPVREIVRKPFRALLERDAQTFRQIVALSDRQINAPAPAVINAPAPKVSTVSHVDPPAASPPAWSRPAPAESNGNGEVSKRQMEILRALAELEAVGQMSPSKECVAVWSRYKATGGGFGNNLGNLKSNGFVHYPAQGTVALTAAGRELAGPQGPPSKDDLMERASAILSGPQTKILNVLSEVYPEAISKEDLAERTGYRATGGGFGNLIGNMRTAGIAVYPSAGTVKAADWLFLE